MSNSSSLVRYLGSRLLLAPVMLWLIASLVFLLLRVAPGDPVDALLGNRASAAARTSCEPNWGSTNPSGINTASF